MRDAAQTEEAPRVEINSQTSNNPPNVDQKRRLRILHVDDDPAILDVSKQILEVESNFEVDTALSVDEAFRKMEQQTYDAVISDYEMPQKNGLDFLKELREQKNTIPFALFTGKGREEVAMTALNLGANGYYNKQGSPETVYGELAHGIHRSIEKRETESQVLYQLQLMQNVSDAIIATDENSVLVSWNQAAEKMYGWKANEVIGRLDQSVLQSESVGTDRTLAIQLLRKTGKFSGELVQLHRDGHRINVETISIGLRDETEEIVGYVSVNRDVTERKKAELALQESEFKFRTIADFAHDWVYWVAPDDGFVYMSPSCERITGYTAEEFIKDPQLLHGIISPQDAELVGPHFDLFSSEKEYSTEFRIKNRSGETRWISHVCEPIFDGDGTLLGRRAVNRDITEHKNIETAIQESEQRWVTTLSSIGDAVISTDVTGRVNYMNAKAEELTGWTLREASKKPLREVFKIVNEQTRLEAESPVAKVLKSGFIVGLAKHTALVQKGGSEIPIDDSAASIKDRNGNITGIVLVFRDATERKKAELVIFEAREYAENIMATIREPLVVLDDNFRVISANNSFYKTFEVTPKETDGNCIYDLGNCQWDIPKLRELLETIIPGKYFFNDFEVEHDFPKIGRRTMLLNARQIRRRKKGANMILVAMEDITERRKAEEKLKESYARVEVMNEKLGVISSLTRHDARNKLSVVIGYAYLMKKKHADESDIVDGLGKMEQAVKDVGKIFDFAKMYERLGVEELAYVDAEKAVNEAVALFPDLTVEVVNDCHGLTVLADSFLRQPFYNFVDNTRKYGKKTTTIRVHYEKTESGELQLVYEDDGVGISTENKLKLFTEGFSTGGSTGFGLFLIKKMMDVYGWQIQEVGEPGKSAKFVITIPKLNKNGIENFQVA